MAVAPRSSGKPKNLVAAARGKKAPRASAAATTKSGGMSGRGLWELVKSIAGMLLIFIVLRTLLVEAFRIPSGSMIPTLQVGDWLFVNKLRYGPHIPFTQTNLPGYAEPRRGEVVVFESPYQADEAAIGNEATPTLVKRLIGMPGDTLYMRAGVVYVNGIAQRQGYGAPAPDPRLGGEWNPLFEWQRGVALASTRFGAAPARPTHDDWGPLLIPAAHYFMMGDNRYDSKDSRYWGLVPRRNVRGRPLFVYYSYEPECRATILCGITGIRWGRIGHVIR